MAVLHRFYSIIVINVPYGILYCYYIDVNKLNHIDIVLDFVSLTGNC